MPGKTGASPFSRRRSERFSRSSSLTRRTRSRSSENGLWRSSPSVRGRLMERTPEEKTSFDYTRVAGASADMPVAAGFLAGMRRAAQRWNQSSEIFGKHGDTLALGVLHQQFLFEVKIERQRAGKMKRKQGHVCAGKILHSPGKFQNLRMETYRPVSVFL